MGFYWCDVDCFSLVSGTWVEDNTSSLVCVKLN